MNFYGSGRCMEAGTQMYVVQRAVVETARLFATRTLYIFRGLPNLEISCGDFLKYDSKVCKLLS